MRSAVHVFFFLYERHFFWRICIGLLFKKGDKAKGVRLLFSLFFCFSKELHVHPFFFLYETVDLFKPFFEIKAGKKAVLAVPLELSLSRQRFLAIKVFFTRARVLVKTRGFCFVTCLKTDLVVLQKNTESLLQYKYKMVEQLIVLRNKIVFRNNFYPKKELFKNFGNSKFSDVRLIFLQKNLNIW